MPGHTTRFLGRERQLARIAALLDEGSHVITIVGGPGLGASRLAHEYGRGRAWLDVRGIDSLGELRARMAALLEVEADDDAIARALAARTEAVVLDGSVGASAAAGLLSRWVRDGGSLVVTARAPLDVEGEVVVELGPLGADDGRAVFLDRVARRGPGVAVDESVVDALVEGVDGLPLAVELMASRAGVLAPAQILARLGPELDAITQTGEARAEAILRRVVAWSWSLLDDHERAVLAQCSVFEGAFSVADAAEKVTFGVEAARVADVLDGLAEKSLLRAQGDEEHPSTFALFESVRAFASERLPDLRP